MVRIVHAFVPQAVARCSFAMLWASGPLGVCGDTRGGPSPVYAVPCSFLVHYRRRVERDEFWGEEGVEARSVVVGAVVWGELLFRALAERREEPRVAAGFVVWGVCSFGSCWVMLFRLRGPSPVMVGSLPSAE